MDDLVKNIKCIILFVHVHETSILCFCGYIFFYIKLFCDIRILLDFMTCKHG